MLWERWLYRSRQFFTALLGRVSAEEMEEARRVLGPPLYEIFDALPGQYRRHALTVYGRLRETGCSDRALLQAALLHDAGKYDARTGRSVTILHRVIIVLLKAAPWGRRLFARLAQPLAEPGGLSSYWRYPFYLSKRHADLGAQLAARHGATPEVVELIANHHKREAQSPALAALRAADEKS